MSKRNWIKAFAPLDRQRLLQTAAESVNWIEQYGHVDGDVESWDVMPGKQVEKDALLLDDASLYAGAAGIALLYLKYYVATEQEKYLRKAEAGIRYVIRKYRGKEDFATEVPFLQGAYIGYLNGPAGGAYVAKELYKITGEERYKQFALTVADDSIEAAKDEQGALTWYGFYGILGEGGLILFLLDVYNTFGGDKYLDAAAKAARGKVGMVFQYPEHQLFAETIYEDIAFGPRNQKKSEDEVEASVRRAMAFVDLDFGTFSQRSPFQLSGGQMRRVAIAGVVAMEPDYLIMDEPSAGLDPVSRDNIFSQLMKIFEKRQMGVILITHSMEEAAQYASRVLVMSGGKLHLDGPSRDIFTTEGKTLQRLSMDVPESVKLAQELRENGLPLEGTPLTKKELIRAIQKAKGWKVC